MLASMFRTLRGSGLPRSRLALFLLFAVAGVLWMGHAIAQQAGGPSVPLDDAFIHFQYARSIAELHPFRYGAPTEPASSGATSVLYPFVLAVPWLIGFRGEFHHFAGFYVLKAPDVPSVGVFAHQHGRLSRIIRTQPDDPAVAVGIAVHEFGGTGQTLVDGHDLTRDGAQQIAVT